MEDWKWFQIKVWTGNWIPTESYFKPFFQYPHSDSHLRVNQLINEHSRMGDTNALTTYFHPRDIERITAIPIPLEPVEDSFIWMSNKKQLFSVQIAYHFAVN